MVFADGALGLVLLGLWIFCIIDVITTPDGATRNLPKLLWLLLVVLLSDVGSILWLVAGRPWNAAGDLPYQGNRARVGVPQAGRPMRPAAKPSNPDDDEEFLAGLRERAEEQRRRGRQQPEQPPAE